MARREGNKRRIIKNLATQVCNILLLLEEGTEISISRIVREIYEEQGYEFINRDENHGYIWTKDGGSTFAIEDFDQFEVLKIVRNKLKGQRELDFSVHYGRYHGLPYNLLFIIRKSHGLINY
ncbi:MAG: hypothetical protein K2H82_10570 [Oscillospiraceae bacterium]|nr:hypothetical protein [Oscillospiraceae bacterium]